MKILITGSNGFIGQNLRLRLCELDTFEVISHLREDKDCDLEEKVKKADGIVHLAGENRPLSEKDFVEVNVNFTAKLCKLVEKNNLRIPIIFSSSSQATIDNPYGRSKLLAEECIKELNAVNDNPCFIYRLPGVFGKWCKPNYNSVVATFCNNIANNLPVKINDENHILNLVYIDDVVTSFINVLHNHDDKNVTYKKVDPEYTVSLGDLYKTIESFKRSRKNLIIDSVGDGLIRGLYATYITYLPKKDFAYPLARHEDNRGIFVEMLKTKDSGQFSFFTAYPGITRGGHYHHTKSEKFLVVKGRALFRFRNLITNEDYKVEISDKDLSIVETIPGWIHDITNIGKDEMIVMLWANEIFDPKKPDTIAGDLLNEKA